MGRAFSENPEAGEGGGEACPFGFVAGQAEAQAGRGVEQAGEDALLGKLAVDAGCVGAGAPLEEGGAGAAAKPVLVQQGGEALAVAGVSVLAHA